MEKKIRLLFLCFIAGFLLSCEKGDETYSFSGKAQKGPFIIGSNVSIYELNENLGQTGRTYTAAIISDDGSFELNDMELGNNLALLTANGFYFNELYGNLSPAALSLQSISDLSEKQSININILTHLTKGRIEVLVANGESYLEAKGQAESEILEFLGVSESLGRNFEELDISKEEEINAVLLSFSIIVQRYSNAAFEWPSLTAELTQLLAYLSVDFKEDGLINNQSLVDTLLYNVSKLNLTDIRNNIETRYSDLGITASIPDFEKYIGKFQEKHKDKIYTTFYYPENAPPDLFPSGGGGELPNILALNLVQPQGEIYSFAALTPLNSTLTIKFIGENLNHSYSISDPQGWEFVNNYPNGFTVHSQRRNELMSMLIYLENSGSAKIEYYENDAEIPIHTKTISWSNVSFP